MVKTTPEGQQEVEVHFRSTNFTTTNLNTIDDDYAKAMEKIKTSIWQYQRLGSGWLIDEVGLKF